MTGRTRLSVVLIFFQLMCASEAAKGLTVDLDLNPIDFEHSQVFEMRSTLYFFSEELSFSRSVGNLGPGEKVDIQLTFPRAIRLENCCSRPFNLSLALTKGFPPPVSNVYLSSDSFIVHASDLNIQSWSDFGSGPSTGGDFTQIISAGLEMTSGFGMIDGIRWNYEAPEWTPPDSDVSLTFSIGTFTRDVSLTDPERYLITFVPEPTTATLALAALCLVMSRRGT